MWFRRKNINQLTAGSALQDTDRLIVAQGGLPEGKWTALSALKTWVLQFLGTIATQSANNINVTGGTITGTAIHGLAAPSASGDAANKTYVDSVQAGVLKLSIPPRGRLCLFSGEPVPSVTRSGKTTIYYTPYIGDQCPIYNGTDMVQTIFTEISAATTDTTKSPAAIGASKLNDWFIWNDSGTIRLSHGPDWTNVSTRSAGTALVMVKGILLNNIAITNGPGASRGTYVGTTYSNSSSQLDWILGSAAAGGGAAWLGVWNAYNRKPVATSVTDSTTSWSTSTSSTPAPMNNGATGSGLNNRMTAVFGLPEDGITISIGIYISVAAAASAYGGASYAMDSVVAPDKNCSIGSAGTVGAAGVTSVHGSYNPQIGGHYWQALQNGDGTHTALLLGAANMNFCGTFMM